LGDNYCLPIPFYIHQSWCQSIRLSRTYVASCWSWLWRMPYNSFWRSMAAVQCLDLGSSMFRFVGCLTGYVKPMLWIENQVTAIKQSLGYGSVGAWLAHWNLNSIINFQNKLIWILCLKCFWESSKFQPDPKQTKQRRRVLLHNQPWNKGFHTMVSPPILDSYISWFIVWVAWMFVFIK